MKMKFILVVIGVVALSCSSIAQEGTYIKSVRDYVVLELDGNNKWQIEDGMRKPIHKSFELIKSSSITSISKAKKLGKKLLSLSDDVIEHCKMKSKGHYVFHSWLVVYLDLLEELRYIEFKEDINYVMTDVNLMIKEFEAYFE